MRVSCTQLPAWSQQPPPGWRGEAIHVGGEYLVLEITTYPGRVPDVRVVDDDERPTLWLSTLFEVTSPRIPSSWKAWFEEDGIMYFGPEAFRPKSFWDEVWGGVPEAKRAYSAELDKLRTEA